MAASGSGGDKSSKPSSLADALTSFSPWSSRSQSPKPPTDKQQQQQQQTQDRDRIVPTGARHSRSASAASFAGGQRGGDHSVSHTHRLSLSRYPRDCPKLDVQWFHAVDVAKRKPHYAASQPAAADDSKPPPAPKKWVAFSKKDSRALEVAFQLVAEEDEKNQRENLLDDSSGDLGAGTVERDTQAHKRTTAEADPHPNRTIGENGPANLPAAKVPVNEDYLFDVDIRNRELGPAYWLGPVYEVRRGSWFYVDGTNLKPCDENLATQLEEGYLKCKPWKLSPLPLGTAATAAAQLDEKDGKDGKSKDATSAKDAVAATPAPPTHRLFGARMNSIVTYEDKTTAWLVADDFFSRMTGTMYQRFAGGAHFSGTKVVRGFMEIKKKGAKEPRRPSSPSRKKTDAGSSSVAMERDKSGSGADSDGEQQKAEVPPEPRLRTLERQMSSLVTARMSEDRDVQDEQARQREEQEIRDDYKDSFGDAQDREIEHLVLVTHGIGQRLGARFEAFNFIHDVNELRKTLKTVYASSNDLQVLNSEIDKLPKNCRVQVLPICWRHLLDFPKQSLKYNRKEFDLGDIGAEEDEKYPSLDDITIDGVPALRNIVADLALDVLLYQTPAYKDHISELVAKECNRIFKLFKQRNPTFRGKVSLAGHSLGSAIMFDILSDQEREVSHLSYPRRQRLPMEKPELRLDFDVENFFCFGSPIGLFQMLKGKRIEARQNPNQVTLDGGSEEIEDPFQESAYSLTSKRSITVPSLVRNTEGLVSSPRCKQLYNIFHPSDPISYRLEPLISPALSSLKPQNLPYVKNNFFGAPMGHGLTGIPAKVGQSFSGFWTSFSSGITNNFINRSLGISPEDAAKIAGPHPSTIVQARSDSAHTAGGVPLSLGAGTNIVGGGVIPTQAGAPGTGDLERFRKMQQEHVQASEKEQRPTTLLDSELETLYSGFQKRQLHRKSDSSSRDFGENPAWGEIEERERRLKREEAKVRALNSNGRVDYSIQEGAFDISFLASIASHLAYWTDEDVCHFMISQLLSRYRTVKRMQSSRSLRGEEGA